MMFALLHAVKEWPRRPSEYGICKPNEDLTWMVAHDQSWAKMQAFEQMKSEEEAERRARQQKHGQR